jgi:heme A synthase
MIDTADSPRSAPRWFHMGAILTLGIVLFPLVLGQLVTTLRAGMADPKWPTEPWYLFFNYKLDVGYLVEHRHRQAGFVLGGVLSLLTIGLGFTEPRKAARWVGVAGLVILLGAFGDFHRQMRGQENAAEVVIPPFPVIGMGIGLLLSLGVGVTGVFAGRRGAGVRLLAIVTLVAVMIQGLLGGTRVLYNALNGEQLATIHGVFAQVVFALLVSLAVLSAKNPPHTVPSTRVRWLANALVALLFVQLVWGAIVRHTPTPLAQRLHFLTAFLVLGGVIVLSLGLKADSAARSRVRLLNVVMGMLVTLQIVLGVEAWMGKFGTYVIPALEQEIPDEKAIIRTAHVLIGTLLLGTVVAIAVRLARRPVRTESPRPESNHYNKIESARDLVGASHSGERS